MKQKTLLTFVPGVQLFTINSLKRKYETTMEHSLKMKSQKKSGKITPMKAFY